MSELVGSGVSISAHPLFVMLGILPVSVGNDGTVTDDRMTSIFVALSVVPCPLNKIRMGCICKSICAGGLPFPRPAPEEEVEVKGGGILTTGVSIGIERARSLSAIVFEGVWIEKVMQRSFSSRYFSSRFCTHNTTHVFSHRNTESFFFVESEQNTGRAISSNLILQGLFHRKLDEIHLV